MTNTYYVAHGLKFKRGIIVTEVALKEPVLPYTLCVPLPHYPYVEYIKIEDEDIPLTFYSENKNNAVMAMLTDSYERATTEFLERYNAWVEEKDFDDALAYAYVVIRDCQGISVDGIKHYATCAQVSFSKTAALFSKVEKTEELYMGITKPYKVRDIVTNALSHVSGTKLARLPELKEQLIETVDMGEGNNQYNFAVSFHTSLKEAVKYRESLLTDLKNTFDNEYSTQIKAYKEKYIWQSL